jgi:SAM-dependent methyltransferase
MRIFRTPRYLDVPELLDRPGEASERDLEHTLRDIRRANIFGLGTWVINHHFERLLASFPRGRMLQVLDLATGSADIPEELCRWARRRRRKIEITATDISAEILAVARERIKRAGFADVVSFLACDAVSTPFPDDSFDVVVCSLALHHLDLASAHKALREMERLSRVGFIVNDIYRSQGAWLMAWVLTHLTTTNRLTRHDGPASVYRAFTPKELAGIADNVHIPVKIHTHPFWRMAAVRTIAERGMRKR